MRRENLFMRMAQIRAEIQIRTYLTDDKIKRVVETIWKILEFEDLGIDNPERPDILREN